MEQSHLVEGPTKAQMAAAEIARTGRSFTKGELVPFSVRVPSWVVAELDAMATHAGASRNHVVNLALEVGLEAIRQSMPSEVLEQVKFLAADAMSMTRQEGKNESGEA